MDRSQARLIPAFHRSLWLWFSAVTPDREPNCGLDHKLPIECESFLTQQRCATPAPWTIFSYIAYGAPCARAAAWPRALPKEVSVSRIASGE